MSRTKGDGWGGDPIEWHICPKCGRKKAMIKRIDYITYLKCTWRGCKKYTRQTSQTHREHFHKSKSS